MRLCRTHPRGSLANQALSLSLPRMSTRRVHGRMSSCVSWLLTAKLRPFSAFYIFFWLPTSHLAQSCAALTLQSHAWQHFFSQPTTHIDALPFPCVLDLIVYLECGTVLLWILPAGDLFTVDSRSIHPCQHSVTQFPCIAFNAANSRFLGATFKPHSSTVLSNFCSYWLSSGASVWPCSLFSARHRESILVLQDYET